MMCMLPIIAKARLGKDQEWMERFEVKLEQAKEYVTCC